MPKFFTIKEVADALQVHPSTVRRFIARGEISAYRVGRMVRIDSEELAKFKQVSPLGVRK